MIEKLIKAIFRVQEEELDFPMYVIEVKVVFSKESYTLGEIQEQALKEFLEETISKSNKDKPKSLEVTAGNIIIKWVYPWPIKLTTNKEMEEVTEKIFDDFISNFKIREIFFEKGKVFLHGFDKTNTPMELNFNMNSLK